MDTSKIKDKLDKINKELVTSKLIQTVYIEHLDGSTLFLKNCKTEMDKDPYILMVWTEHLGNFYFFTEDLKLFSIDGEISINEDIKECVDTPIYLYADGACEGNPGKGGYGAVLKCKNKEMYFSKGYKHTTNNRMELLGVIEPLEEIYKNGYFKDNPNKKLNINIFSDSKYVVNAINENWLINWKKNKWKKSDGKKVLNKDLWERLDILLSKFNLDFIWVKGHSSNDYNNKCDVMAVKARKNNILEEDANYKSKN